MKKQKNRIFAILIALVVILSMLTGPVAAADIKAHDLGNASVTSAVKNGALLDLNQRTFKSASGIATGSGLYRSKHAANDGTRGYAVDVAPGKTYSNPLTLTFENCGAVMGEQTRVVVHFNSVSFGTRWTNDGIYTGKSIVIAGIGKNNISVGCDTFKFGKHVYGGKINITYTATVYSMKTGKVINYPFAVGLSDIDQNNKLGKNYVTEGATVSGAFSDYYYWRSQNKLVRSGRTFSCPKPELDVDTLNDSWKKAGVIAVTAGNANSFTVTHHVGGSMATAVQIYKVVNSGQFKVQKTASSTLKHASGYNFAGITYGVYKNAGTAAAPKEGSYIGSITLDAAGNSKTTELSAGNYVLKETATNGFYSLNQKLWSFTIKAGVTNTIVKPSDPPITKTVTINKVVKPNEGSVAPGNLSGLNNNLKFKLTSASSSTVFACEVGKSYDLQTGAKTDLNNQQVQFTGVPIGTYILTEDASSLVAAQQAINNTTDIKGHFDVERSVKTYTVTVASSGVTIKNGDTATTEYINYWETDAELRLQINKAIIGEGELSGWKFALYDNEACKGTPIGTATTNENGQAVINNIPKQGTYYIKELDIASTHRALQNPMPVVIAKTTTNLKVIDGKTVALNSATFTNTEKFVDIKVYKRETLEDGSAGSNISGIKFKLYKNGKEIATKTTGSDGTLVFSGDDYHLGKGEYVIEEQNFDEDTYAPGDQVEGYKMQSKAITVDGGEGEVAVHFNNIEGPNGFPVRIIKKSSVPKSETLSNYTFEGIKYGVYADAACTDLLAEETLGEEGEVIIKLDAEDDEETKDVWVKEISSNDSYKLSSKVTKLTLIRDEYGVVEAEDTPETGSLSFTKVVSCDDERAKIPSPEDLAFNLINKADGSLKYTAHPTASGAVTFSDVLLGEYYLTESGCDEYENGYMVDITGQDGPVSVTINKGSNTIEGDKWENEWEPDKNPGAIDVVKTTDNGALDDLSEFHITITDLETNKVIADNVALSRYGTYTIDDLYPGQYKVEENLTEAQKKLYNQPEAQIVTVEEGETEHVLVELFNEVKTANLTVIKKSSDGNIGNIEFELRGTSVDGQEIRGIYASTEEAIIEGEKVGTCTFEKVKAGEYIIEEVGFNAAYYTSNHRVEGIDNPAQKVVTDGVEDKTITFINTPFEFSVSKTECLEDGTPTDTPLEGAKYTLFKVTETITSEDELYNFESIELITGEDGKASTNEIEKGTYYVYETSIPQGYVEDYSVPADYFDLNAEESAIGRYVGIYTIGDESPVATLSDTNQRQWGSIFFSKEDDAENPVEGAVFGLYTDPLCLNLAVNNEGTEMKVTTDQFGGITDANGVPFFKGLAWGTYYLKEIKAPRGYEKIDEPFTVEIGPGSVMNEVASPEKSSIVNQRAKGNITLVKQDADDRDILLDGAEFSLYTAEGELVRDGLVTGTDNDGDGEPDGEGQIAVGGLTWGSYYFQETKAPENYVLEPEPSRFSVNAFSSITKQTVYAKPNIKAQASVTLTIMMKADDFWEDHGEPTFFAVLEGEGKTYKRPITFDKAFIEKNIDGNGYVSKSVTFNIPAGEYRGYSVKADRYFLDEDYPLGPVHSIESGVLGSDNDADFTIPANGHGVATFVYTKTDWRDFGDQTAKVNMIRKNKVFTGLSVAYLGDADGVAANMPFTKDMLSVYALYDDGTTVELSDTEFSVTDPNNGDAELTRFPTVTGSYTYTVSATRDGTTRYGTFTVFVKPWQKVKLYFHPNGGSTLSGKTGTEEIDGENVDYIEVWQYQTLQQAKPDPAAYTPEKTGFDLEGWYTEPEFTNRLDPAAEIVESAHYYANWEIAKYRINYNANNPDSTITITGVPAQQIKTYNEAITLSSASPSMDKGYTFKGWATTPGGNVAYAPGAEYTDNKHLNLYAVWEPNKATLTYDGNGASSLGDVPETVTMRYNAATYITAEKPTFDGEEFRYWTTNPDGTGTKYYPGDEFKAIYTEPEDTTLYAISGVRSEAYAVYDSADNSLKFFKYFPGEYENNQVIGTKTYYTGIETRDETNASNAPWNSVAQQITSVTFEDEIKPVSTAYWFYNMQRITGIEHLDRLDTSSVTNMNSMFYRAGYNASSFSLDLSSFDTSNVTNMRNMFYYAGKNASSFSLDLSSFDTSSVTDMNNMFNRAGKGADTFSLDLSSFDTSSVTDMVTMFYDCSALKTIYISPKWNTDAVISGMNMFYGCTSLVGGNGTAFNSSWTNGKNYAKADIPGQVGYLTMGDAFTDGYAVYDSADNSLRFFRDKYYKYEDGQVVGTKTYYAGIERRSETGSSNAPWSSVATSITSVTFEDEIKPVNTGSWFYNMQNISGITNLDKLNTSSVTDMNNMFNSAGYSANTFSLDLSSFNTSSVTDMKNMFIGCAKLNKIYISSSWDTASVTSSSYMFSSCNALVGGNGTRYNSSYTDKTYARADLPGQPGYLTLVE